MLRTRLILPMVLCLVGLVAPSSALAAVGISPARALTKPKTSRTGMTKESLSIATDSPASGATVSGSIPWTVSISAGTASKVEFAIDGTVDWTQSSAPYSYGGSGGTLDTTKLSNGSHVLTATAYGSRGTRATAKVTVTVSNEEAEAPPLPGTGSPIYWGATIGSQLTGSQAPWDMSAVSKFEELSDKSLSLIQFFQPFANCSVSPCSFYPFPGGALELVRQHGAIPVLSWASQSTPSSRSEPNFQLSDVIEGKYDTFIRNFAVAAREWGHPFFLRFNHEMNGDWFPWSERANGNGPGEYVAAWRHVHDIFTSVGATNATWVWCPNVDPDNVDQNLSSLYPGDAYVDWTGLDGYNWGTNPVKPDRWRTFNELFKTTYEKIVGSIAPAKPMMIGEMASSEYGGSKAAWIDDALARIPTEYPQIRSLLWFDKSEGSLDWPVESSSTATAAFAAGISALAYQGNSFGSLADTAILPAG